MNKQRRAFYRRGKRQAAALVLDQGHSHSEDCGSLGITDSALHWVKQLREGGQSATPKSKALTSEQHEIQALQARINPLEREKAIVKKLPLFGCRTNSIVRADRPVE